MTFFELRGCKFERVKFCDGEIRWFGRNLNLFSFSKISVISTAKCHPTSSMPINTWFIDTGSVCIVFSRPPSSAGVFKSWLPSFLSFFFFFTYVWCLCMFVCVWGHMYVCMCVGPHMCWCIYIWVCMHAFRGPRLSLEIILNGLFYLTHWDWVL